MFIYVLKMTQLKSKYICVFCKKNQKRVCRNSFYSLVPFHGPVTANVSYIRRQQGELLLLHFLAHFSYCHKTHGAVNEKMAVSGLCIHTHTLSLIKCQLPRLFWHWMCVWCFLSPPLAPTFHYLSPATQSHMQLATTIIFFSATTARQLHQREHFFWK